MDQREYMFKILLWSNNFVINNLMQELYGENILPQICYKYV
jgi:hypothetical protein